MGAWSGISDGGRGASIPSAHPTGFAPAALALFLEFGRGARIALRSGPTTGFPSKRCARRSRTLEKTLGIDRLLVRPELCAEAGRLFLDRYGELIELSASGQLAMRGILEEHLKRVEWDSSKFPVRLYPFVFADDPSEVHWIVIDPRIAFGRPVLLRGGVSTSAIAEKSTRERPSKILPPTTISTRQKSSGPRSTSGPLSRVYFTDRDLGKRFPEILRSSGLNVERHGDHFAPDTPDAEWLEVVGDRGWIAITHDRRIRYKPNERDAVMLHRVALLVVVGAAPFPDLRALSWRFPRIEHFLTEHGDHSSPKSIDPRLPRSRTA